MLPYTYGYHTSFPDVTNETRQKDLCRVSIVLIYVEFLHNRHQREKQLYRHIRLGQVLSIHRDGLTQHIMTSLSVFTLMIQFNWTDIPDNSGRNYIKKNNHPNNPIVSLLTLLIN